LRLVHADAQNLKRALDLIDAAIAREPARRDFRARREENSRAPLSSAATRCAFVVGDVTTPLGAVPAITLLQGLSREETAGIGKRCVEAVGGLDARVYGDQVILHELREIFVELSLSSATGGASVDFPDGYRLDEDTLIDTDALAKKFSGGADAG
jgi:hypothetical protein